MKTALVSLLAATLMGFASQASGRALDAADFITLLFSAGLIAWTIDQYNRPLRGYELARPIRLPVNPVVRPSRLAAGRLAA